MHKLKRLQVQKNYLWMQVTAIHKKGLAPINMMNHLSLKMLRIMS